MKPVMIDNVERAVRNLEQCGLAQSIEEFAACYAAGVLTADQRGRSVAVLERLGRAVEAALTASRRHGN